MKPVVVCVALVLVFGWLLPRFVDYQAVWAALKELAPWEVVTLFGLARARVPSEALMHRAFLPGLGLQRGSETYLSSNLTAQVLPPPGASVVQYGYFRGGGYPADAAGLAALGSFLFPTLGRLVLPLAALVALLVVAEIDGVMLLVSALSLLVLAVVGAGAYCLLPTERSARWLGAKLQRPLSWMLGAIAFWAGAVFPITGSGLGVVDGVLIASLIETSSAPDDTLVAAALLWRVFYSFVTLPLGAITLSRSRKTNPEVLHSSAARP